MAAEAHWEICRYSQLSVVDANFKPALMDLWTTEGKEWMLRNIDEKFSEVFVSTSLLPS